MSKASSRGTTRRVRLTPKQRVLKRIPRAFAHSCADCWVIYQPTNAGNEEIGTARSAAVAWKLAWMRISL